MLAAAGDAVPKFAVPNRLKDEGKVNLMGLAEALMEKYLASKHVWELERDAMVKNTRAKNEDMKDVARKLAHITSIRKAQLAAKHADAVVRGYSHTTRRHMDIRAQLRCCKSRRTRFARQPALWMVPEHFSCPDVSY